MSWQTIFTYVPFGFWGLLYLTFVRRIDIRVRHQARWMMVLLLCLSKFLCFRELGGNMFNPELPPVLIWAWDWAYSGAVILFGLSVVFLFRFKGKAAVLPVAAWALAGWGLWSGLRVPDVKEVDLTFANLPPSLEGYRIAHLSDLHCSCAAPRWRTQAVVDLVNEQHVDLICLTGDHVDGSLKNRAQDLAPLGELRARDGVFACTGNHEYYFGFHEWMDFFYQKETNIRYLTNECVFPRPDLALAGVPDKTGWGRGLDEPPDVRQAFAMATNGAFRILLQHRPQTAEENVLNVGVDLQLSGHTHGGIAPGMGVVVARCNAGFVRGFYRIGRSFLHVSPGCGQWAGFPVRFFDDSEVTVIRLTSGRRRGSISLGGFAETGQ